MNYQNIDAQHFAELMEKDGHIVLDVRSPGELADGEVPGYTMINFFDSDFRDQVSKLDKSKTYLVYCRSGNRSGQACALKADLGFKHLYNLSGGIGAWNSAQVAS